MLHITEKEMTDRDITVKLTLNDLTLYLSQESKEEFYSKTTVLCDLFVHVLPNWLLNFTPSTPITLDVNLYNSK